MGWYLGYIIVYFLIMFGIGFYYFLKVKSALITLIAQNPDDGEYALDLLMIAKYFERIGDHATNIAEWVLFSVTGVHKGEDKA